LKKINWRQIMQPAPQQRPPRGARGWPARAAEACSRLQTWLMVACLAAMVVLLFGNVALRYLFNSGINASDELSRLAFVWLIFLGAVLALRDHQHIGVTMLVQRFGPRARKLVHVVCQLLTLWVLWLMAEGGWAQTLIGTGTRLPVTGLPLAVFDAAVLYAAVAMGLLVIVDLVRVLAGGDPPLDAAAEDTTV